MSEAADIEKMLMQVGLTQLESAIYLHLTRHGPGTGYAIAKGVSKAVANVYKALQSLAVKGAVAQSTGKTRIYTAVPWRDFLASVKAKQADTLDALEDALSALPAPNFDEEIYKIQNIGQLKDQALAMVNGAKSIVLADIDPRVLPWFQDAMTRAAARGVEVRIKIYEPADLPGLYVTLRENGKDVYTKTKDCHFSLCSDGDAMMRGLLNEDLSGVIQAFTSRGALMVIMLYNQLLYELVLTDLKRLIPVGDLKGAQALLAETEHLHAFSAENMAFDHFQAKYRALRD